MPKIPRVESTKKASKVATKFWTYTQNNSGGTWAKGMPQHLIVEATSAADADSRAIDARAYFDGCDSGLDCSCCGDRWYRAFSEDGDVEPKIYGQDPAAYFASSQGRMWKVLCCRIVYMDGRVEEV